MSVQYRSIRGTNALIDEDQYKAVADHWRAGEFGSVDFTLKFREKSVPSIGETVAEVNAGHGDTGIGSTQQYRGVVEPDYNRGLMSPRGRPLVVADLLAAETTSSNLIRLVKDDEETDGAGQKTEGAEYGNATEQPAPHDWPVVDTVVKMAVTEDFLMDVPAAMPYLVKRLSYLAQRDEELSLIGGNGTIPAHLGLLNAADSSETATTVARGGQPIPTAVAHLIEEVFSKSGLYPTWTLMNPLRWLEYMTLRGDAGANSYIAGYPSRDAAHIFSLWGTRVAISKAMPQDDIIVGSEAAASRWVHTSGMKVEASPFYSTFFGEGRVLVRAKIRTALAYDYASGIGVLSLGS